MNDRDLRIKELTKQLADAHVARELDEILLKRAATERQELLKLRESSSTQTEHITQQANTIAELATKIGSLEGEIRGLKDSNARLGELLACSSEYKVLGRMSRPGEQEQPPADRQTNIRYLKGSGGVGKKDLVDEIRNVVGKRGLPSKFHWTYKYWDKLSTTGRIEQEDMLWTPERCIEIVKEFQNGNYSKDPDLAIEKLLFEVLSGLSQLGKIYRTVNNRKTTPVIKKLKTQVKQLRVQLKYKQNEVQALYARLAVTVPSPKKIQQQMVPSISSERLFKRQTPGSSINGSSLMHHSTMK